MNAVTGLRIYAGVYGILHARRSRFVSLYMIQTFHPFKRLGSEFGFHPQIVWDDGIRLSKRRDEREQGRNDAEEDLSELSEGEKEKSDVVTALEPSRDNMMPRIRSGASYLVL